MVEADSTALKQQAPGFEHCGLKAVLTYIHVWDAGVTAPSRRCLLRRRIPFLPTDVLRTVLRRVLPELDAIDQDPVDGSQLAEFM